MAERRIALRTKLDEAMRELVECKRVRVLKRAALQRTTERVVTAERRKVELDAAEATQRAVASLRHTQRSLHEFEGLRDRSVHVNTWWLTKSWSAKPVNVGTFLLETSWFRDLEQKYARESQSAEHLFDTSMDDVVERGLRMSQITAVLFYIGDDQSSSALLRTWAVVAQQLAVVRPLRSLERNVRLAHLDAKATPFRGQRDYPHVIMWHAHASTKQVRKLATYRGDFSAVSLVAFCGPQAIWNQRNMELRTPLMVAAQHAGADQLAADKAEQEAHTIDSNKVGEEDECKIINRRVKVFEDILDQTKTVQWKYGPVECVQFPLDGLDGSCSREEGALQVLMDSQSLEAMETPVISYLLQRKWHKNFKVLIRH